MCYVNIVYFFVTEFYILSEMNWGLYISLNSLKILEFWEAVFHYLKVLENGNLFSKVLDNYELFTLSYKFENMLSV